MSATPRDEANTFLALAVPSKVNETMLGFFVAFRWDTFHRQRIHCPRGPPRAPASQSSAPADDPVSNAPVEDPANIAKILFFTSPVGEEVKQEAAARRATAMPAKAPS